MAKLVQVEMLQGLAGVSYTYDAGSLQQIEIEEAKRLEEHGICKILTKANAKQNKRTTSRGAGNTGSGKGLAKG